MAQTADLVRELLRAGKWPAAIARELGLAPATVDYHLSRLAAQPSRSGESKEPPLPPTESSRRSTRERVAALLAEGKSRTGIAAALALGKPTVTYHARRLGESLDAQCARRYDWDEVQRHYDRGFSVRECMGYFGFSSYSWSAAVRRGAIIPRPQAMSIAELLAKPRNRTHLKQRLLSAGLKENRCEECGIAEWRGRPLSMALHHMNGDRHDNRLENLRLLCPNCHSQTDTFAGRNGRGRRGSERAPVRPSA